MPERVPKSTMSFSIAVRPKVTGVNKLDKKGVGTFAVCVRSLELMKEIVEPAGILVEPAGISVCAWVSNRQITALSPPARRESQMMSFAQNSEI